ncbi:MAG: ABC transporter permease [Gemmatimonadetes bacterium]|nr:ABC transporter permease [Gemmatimonadota bacterium]
MKVAAVYARLLRLLLPPSLRAEYGADAEAMFRDHARAAGTRAARLHVLLRALADLAVQAVAVRLERDPVMRAVTRELNPGVRRRLAELRTDGRHAVRQWRRAPGFALAALATLGLGIGVTTAMFTVVNGVVLRPLPFADPDRLVMVWERNLERGWPRFTVSPANYFDWAARATRFENVAAYTSGTATLTDGGEAIRLQTAAAWWSVFHVLGSGPVIGRGFVEEENQVGRDEVVILSHRLWVTRFGADPAILDRSVSLDGRAQRVIGVLPPDFGLSPDADVWVPLVFPFDIAGARGAKYLSVVAQLAEGATASTAQAQLDEITAALEREYAATNAGWTAVVVPLREQMLGSVERTLLLLFAAVAIVMLIACSNVVNLLLARGTTRGEEFSLRKAMGAGAGRLARQIVVETLLLSGAGAATGLAIAVVLTRVLVAANPGRLPRVANIELDATVLAFCVLLTLVVGVAIALVPAVQASRASVFAGLEAGRSGATGRKRRRLRNGLLVAEIAMAVVLMVGWGMVAQRLNVLMSIDPGFRAAGLVTARLSPPASRYPTPADRAAFYAGVTERLRAQPLVERIAVVNRLPLTGSLSYLVNAEREPVPSVSEWRSGELRAVSPEYFETMDVRMLRGRTFASTDDGAAPPVAIVNATLARMLFPGDEPLGRRILVSSGDAACPCEVVGIAADVREAGLDQPTSPVYYLPQTQSVWTTRNLVIRSSASLAAVVAALREAVRAVDPEVALFDVQPLEQVVGERLATPRFHALLLGIFAALALFLATIGVYGVTSYVVGLRRREMGVRSALGAGTTGLIWLIERESLIVALAGISLGLAGAAASTRFIIAAFAGVEPMRAGPTAGVAVFLALVSASAAFVPAWRAGRVDPAEALRLD